MVHHITACSVHAWYIISQPAVFMVHHITACSVHGTSYHSLQCSWYIISQPAVFMVHHITACSVHGTSYHSLQCSWYIISQPAVFMVHHITAYSVHGTSCHSLQCSWYIMSQPAVFMVHHVTACSVHGTSYHSLQCSWYIISQPAVFMVHHITARSVHAWMCSKLPLYITIFKFAGTSLHSQADESDYSPPPPASDEGTTHHTALMEEQEEEEVRTCVVNSLCLRWIRSAWPWHVLNVNVINHQVCFVMFHDTSCHSVHAWVFKVATLAILFATLALHSQGRDSDIELLGGGPPLPSTHLPWWGWRGGWGHHHHLAECWKYHSLERIRVQWIPAKKGLFLLCLAR